jgi:carboxylesterase type B
VIDDHRRPVLVFIHGGAFVLGSGSLPMYHVASFAMRHDLVAVTLNDRLAEGGSLYLGHLDPEFSRSGNRPHFSEMRGRGGATHDSKLDLVTFSAIRYDCVA